MIKEKNILSDRELNSLAYALTKAEEIYQQDKKRKKSKKEKESA